VLDTTSGARHCFKVCGTFSDSFHRSWIPVAGALLGEADIAEQRGACGAVAEYAVFNEGLAAANCVVEVAVMLQVHAVACGSGEYFLLVGAHAIGCWPRARILRAVLGEELFLDSFGECIDGVAGFGFARVARDGEVTHRHVHGSFAAHEAISERFRNSAAGEIDAQGEREFGVRRGLGIFKEREHYVLCVAPILPEPDAACGEDARWSKRTGGEVQAAQKVHVEIAGYAGAVVAIVAPTEEANRLMEQFGLTKTRDQKAMTLSGGERRKLEIARSLVTNPSLILLDEPFSGVDPIAVEDLQREIRQLKDSLGKAILITDHNVQRTLEVCDRGIIIDNGKVLAQGTPKELINNPLVRQTYLGHTFRGDEFD